MKHLEKDNFADYKYFGSHIKKSYDRNGVMFRVWAPNAKRVMVIGDFNNWNGNSHIMQKVEDKKRNGCFQLFVSGLGEGEKYKFLIQTQDDKLFYKSDPYARTSEHTPGFCSIVTAPSGYIWKDREWMVYRNIKKWDEKLNIYEIHLGSWKRRENGETMNYREIADQLVPYVKDLRFTHVELLPITEYPHDLSWGYQVTGYYSVTSRYGDNDDFRYFVDKFHQAGIGVILDWVPGHFCKDEHGLYRFDGTALYEYDDPLLGDINEWGTANFDLSKPEVQRFIASNAMFWIKEYHIDGFRMDAMANILYLDYGERKNLGLKNIRGGNENLEAAKFIKFLNKTISKHFPSVILISEEPTLWPGSTKPVNEGGLGFSYKWNMGFINDTLNYMSMNPELRKENHFLLTFSIMYAFAEKFILSLSHDEVSNGGKSLYNRIYGSRVEKLAGLKLFYGYFMAHPGKKLQFMGCEFGQVNKWDGSEELEWHLLNETEHKQIFNYVNDLNRIYEKERSLWELDSTYDGFEWIDCDNSEESLLGFMRKGKKDDDFLIVACNFSPNEKNDYLLTVPNFIYKEIINSDDEIYGGGGLINKGTLKQEGECLRLRLAPLSVCFIKPSGESDELKGRY